jgi:hypothetical protein
MSAPDADRAKLWFLRGALMSLEGDVQDGSIDRAEMMTRIKRITVLMDDWLPELHVKPTALESVERALDGEPPKTG